MGLYKDGLIYGGAYTWTIFCVSNKQVRHKQVSHKQENKHVLSSDYWTYINSGDLCSRGLYSGGLIFAGAYIWNEVSVSTCGGLIHGGLIFGGAYSRRFTVYNYWGICPSRPFACPSSEAQFSYELGPFDHY
jgi:hypothetical protein